MSHEVRIMGIPFPKLTLEESVQKLSEVIERRSGELFHVVTGNPEIVMACQHDRQLRSIVDEAGMLSADGIGIVLVSRVRGGKLPERVTGCDLLIKLLETGNEKKWTFYMLGAAPTASELAAANIAATYPNASIVGRHHGYFNEEQEAHIIHEIQASAPDFLIVALGAPNAERWIHKHRKQLNARVAIGVGGSLDILAGTVPRAPMLWRKWNLEWLFRLINQPSRWRRQLLLPRFAFKALVYKEK